MATSPANTNRLFDGGIQFLQAVNSNLHPTYLGSSQYPWSINTVNKGGIIDTRDGYDTVFRTQDGKAQGMTMFTATGQAFPSMVVAVNGKIFVSNPPYTEFSQLPNIQFDPFVDQIVFKEAVQSVRDGQVVDPLAVLIMQDGRTPAAYWDGLTNRHLRPGGANQETVMGLAMEWIGSRLWIARGRELFASDIFDPLHFIENQYLATGGSLQAMDGDFITCLRRTADNKNLLVFTIHNTTIVRAGITDRDVWKDTPDFVSLLFPGVGCTGAKAIAEKNGELWWFSVEGARRFTQVGASVQTSRNSIASIEMERSFANLSPLLSRVCAFNFGSYLGFSVPSGDVYNRHTWVLDSSIADQLTSVSAPAWQGAWMGTRPVEWASASVNGKERCFYLSQDYCGVRVWEAFKDSREDNGARIYCSTEFPGLVFEEPTAFKRFLFTELHLTRLSGDVNITVDYKGDWGCWKRIMDVNLCAVDCKTTILCDASNPPISTQNRFIKTQEAKQPACLTQEGAFSEDIGTYFQNRIRWWGKNALRMYRSQANQVQENSNGACARDDTTCKLLACCDPELTYISHVHDGGYGYGSSASVSCSL